MKYTCPRPSLRVWDPKPPIFHLLALGVGTGGNANFSVCIGSSANFGVFRYQHVGIPNAKLWRGGLSQREDPTRMVLRRSRI